MRPGEYRPAAPGFSYGLVNASMAWEPSSFRRYFQAGAILLIEAAVEDLPFSNTWVKRCRPQFILGFTPFGVQPNPGG
jgi:hypothetical protein